MRKTNVFILSSLNHGKIVEYRELFKEFPEYQLKTLSEVVFNPNSLSKVETGKTYHENAFLKCRYGHYAAKYPTFSDDTGLEIDALDGKPGVFSSSFGKPKNSENQDEANLREVLEKLKGVPKDKRTARFVCTIVFMVEGVELVATENVEGIILDSPSGSGGFGYDPIFVPKGNDLSLGKMSLQEKNAISHRAKALRNLIAQIKEKKIELVHP